MVKENAAVSQKLLAALPSDPFEQLEVAQSITSMAVIAGVNKLEAESGRFRETLEEREKTIHSMQQRIHELEHSLEETSVRLSQALEHQVSQPTNYFSLLSHQNATFCFLFASPERDRYRRCINDFKRCPIVPMLLITKGKNK